MFQNNVSLISLSLKKLCPSPFLSISGSQKKKNIELRFLQTQYGISNFLFSNKVRQNTRVYDSQFSKYLKTPLLINSRHIGDRKFLKSGYLEENIEDITVERCEFLNCNHKTWYGGAIYSSVNTKIIKCRFIGCESKNGGAVYVEGDLSVDQTLFQDLASEDKNGGIFMNGETNLINQSSFINCKSNNFAVFSIYSNLLTDVIKTNCTGNKVYKYCNNYEIGSKKSKIYYCLTTKVEPIKDSRNSGICIYNSNSIVKSSIFSYLQCNSDQIHGSAIWIDGSEFEGKITKCSFIECSSKKFTVIMVANAHKVELSNNCFTGNFEASIVSSDKLIVADNNVFNNKCEISKPIISYTAPAKEKQQKNNSFYIFFAFVFLICTLLLMNKRRVRRLCKQTMRPVALESKL